MMMKNYGHVRRVIYRSLDLVGHFSRIESLVLPNQPDIVGYC